MTRDIVNTYTWTLDAIVIWLRYFFLAGLGYFLFYILWKKQGYFQKIQKKKPATKTIHREIRYSIFTLCIYCLTSLLTFTLVRHGFTRIYLDITEFGYPYFFASIALMVLLHDAYFYWTHRLMHLPFLFRKVHLLHHRSHNPTPWTAFAFHPFEAIISVGIIPILIFLIPCHPYALSLFLTFMTLVNVLGHLGYELFPFGFRKSKLGKWQNTASNHDLHHRNSKHNFGLYFTIWDRIMKTHREPNNHIIQEVMNEA